MKKLNASITAGYILFFHLYLYSKSDKLDLISFFSFFFSFFSTCSIRNLHCVHMDLVLEILMNIEDDSFLLFFADLKELDLTGNLLSDWKVCLYICRVYIYICMYKNYFVQKSYTGVCCHLLTSMMNKELIIAPSLNFQNCIQLKVNCTFKALS